eukprot:COSAG01_NODE_1894_length_8959_cov_3.852603_9_plen_108_part_00
MRRHVTTLPPRLLTLAASFGGLYSSGRNLICAKQGVGNMGYTDVSHDITRSKDSKPSSCNGPIVALSHLHWTEREAVATSIHARILAPDTCKTPGERRRDAIGWWLV